MALHPPIGPLKTGSGLEPVPRYEPSTYKPISQWHTHTIGGERNVLFNDGYMVSDIWLRTILIVRKETWLTARVLLDASSHRQDSTYHGLCYTSRGALDGTRNSSVGSPHEGSIRWPIAPWANSLTTELHLTPNG